MNAINEIKPDLIIGMVVIHIVSRVSLLKSFWGKPLFVERRLTPGYGERAVICFVIRPGCTPAGGERCHTWQEESADISVFH